MHSAVAVASPARTSSTILRDREAVRDRVGSKYLVIAYGSSGLLRVGAFAAGRDRALEARNETLVHPNQPLARPLAFALVGLQRRALTVQIRRSTAAASVGQRRLEPRASNSQAVGAAR